MPGLFSIGGMAVKKASSFAALGGLVYSTDSGRMCPQCQQPQDSCSCAAGQQPVGDGKVRVSRSNKGRGGKTVTLVSGLPVTLDEAKQLCSQLKKRCGTGGAVKEGVIEIQGDRVDVVLQWLQEQGFAARRSGG